MPATPPAGAVHKAYIISEREQNCTMKKLLIFDFDGVIEDTFELTFNLFKDPLPTLTREEYRSWFDGNVHNAIHTKEISTVDKYIFYKKYTEGLQRMSIGKPLKRALTTLHKNSAFSIVSSSLDDALCGYLRQNNIHSLFKHVWGMEKSTSKIEKLEELITLYALPKENYWFITDTLGDIHEAHSAGIQSVAVTWGFHSRARLEQGNPVAVVDTPEELLHFFDIPNIKSDMLIG